MKLTQNCREVSLTNWNEQPKANKSKAQQINQKTAKCWLASQAERKSATKNTIKAKLGNHRQEEQQ